MAGLSDYRNEQFIRQYEHILKLKLLTKEQLSQVKRKRSFFEVSIKNSPEIKSYLNYIKYELALMKKFKKMDSKNKHDVKAMDQNLSFHVRDLFKLTLKKFKDKRKVWDFFLMFSKQKFPKMVTSIYRDMLHFHHKTEDYIEAAQHEIFNKNYLVAMNLLVQGMGVQSGSCQKLVVIYIECSIKQANDQNEEVQEATLLQAAKFYEKFLKESEDISLYKELLQKIQSFDYSKKFQNIIIAHLLETYPDEAEVEEILAERHLQGLFYGPEITLTKPPK